MVLRQEDGAVRPEKNIALETHQRVVTKRNAKDTRNERIARPEDKVDLDTLEKEDRAVRPEKNTALLCRDETKREGNAKRTHCPPEEEVTWIPQRKKTELSAQRKIQPCCVETKRDAKVTRNERNAALLVSISVRKRHILDCLPQTSGIIYCPTVRTRPGGQHSQNWFHQDDGLTPVGESAQET